jgi:hypothetical protein
MRSASLLFIPALAAACSSENGSPTAPTRLADQPATLPSAGTAGASHGLRLVAVQGTGAGLVNVSPTSEGAGFTAQITVNVHGLPPSTTVFVQRSPDFPVVAGQPDGICQREAGLPPYEAVPPWVTFPIPNPGPLTTITTSPGGAGAVSFPFDVPAAAEVTFDVMFRVVDNTTAPSLELRTACFQVTPR